MAERFLRFGHLSLSPGDLKGRTTSALIVPAVQQQMRHIWVQAAQQFLLSLASETLVESGESFGALIAAAGEVGLSLTLPSVSSRKKRPQLELIGGAPIPGTMRSLGSGIRRGRGFFIVEFVGDKYEFTFSFSVFQAALHDAGAGNNGPTSAQDAAARAIGVANQFAVREFRETIAPLIVNWITTGNVESFRA